MKQHLELHDVPPHGKCSAQPTQQGISKTYDRIIEIRKKETELKYTVKKHHNNIITI